MATYGKACTFKRPRDDELLSIAELYAKECGSIANAIRLMAEDSPRYKAGLERLHQRTVESSTAQRRPRRQKTA